MIDFPRVAGGVSNRAEEDAVGKSRAYLVNYSAPQLTNWKTDGNGAFEWVVLKTHRTYQEGFDGSELVSEDQWAYYDRENFRTYRLRRTERGGNGGGADGSDGVELVNQGRHGLAEIRRVPLVKLAVTDGLWLANKAALLQQEHFNKSNALAWALHMGLFAMPVIYSEREWQQIVGEAYYIQLGPNDRFGWDEGTERSTDMDLKAYYRKVREIEASIEDEFPLIKSLATEDGGAGGQLTEVTRAIAARRFFDGIAEPAMPDEVRDYRKNAEEARKKEEQRRRSAEIQFTILSEADLRALQGASRNAAVGGWRPRLMGPGVVWVSPFGIAGEPRLARSECPVSLVGGECLAFVEDFSAYVAAGGRVVGLRPVLDGWISTAVARGPPASTVCAVKDCAVTNAAVAVFTS